MKNKCTVLSLVAALCLPAGACKEDILDVNNQSQYSADTYFTNANTMNQAVVASYAGLLKKGMFSRDWFFVFDLAGDEAEATIKLQNPELQFHDYSYGANNGTLYGLWATLYEIVLRTNLVIDKAGAWKPTLSADVSVKGQYLAEAHFLKGLAQFYLVSIWGRVPLKTDYKTSTDNYYAGRNTVEEVWAAVEADLTLAVAGLPVKYDNANLGRATQGAAIALLGKAYLYQQKYAQAAAELIKLTRTPFAYALNPSFDAQFSENNGGSSETVFDIPHGKWLGWGVSNAFYMFGGQEAWGGKATHSGRAMEYGFNDYNNAFVSKAARAAFQYPDDQGLPYTDPRAGLTYYSDAANGGDVTYCDQCADGPIAYPFTELQGQVSWRKYGNYEKAAKLDLPVSEINAQVIRYADVLLMLAESLVMQGNTAGALPLLNQVRARAGAFAYPALGDPTNAMQLLMRERQVELCGEQSRWFDLARWTKAGLTDMKRTLNAQKQAALGIQPFQDKHLLFPIPLAEKNTNPAVAADVANDWN